MARNAPENTPAAGDPPQGRDDTPDRAGLTLSAVLDRELAWRNGGSVRYLVASVQAPELAPAGRSEPRPLNLALVVDASGSMSGERLQAAKRAAAGIAGALSPRDRLSVVSFSSDVQVHADAPPCDAAGSRQALAAIDSLETRGATNLAAGWLQGAECVARAAAAHPGLQCRVILLSDGQANEGIVDPAELAVHASAMREHGVLTSCVGIGDDYSTVQMQALADHGGGRMHDAQRPEEIVEVVVAELKDMAQSAAEAVEARLHAPRGMTVEAMGGYPTRHTGDGLACAIGSLPGGASRQAIFRLTCPRGETGDTLALQASVAWRRPGESNTLTIDAPAVSLRFAPGRENGPQPRNIAASVQVALVWQADVVRQAIRMNRDGRVQDAAAWLLQQLRHFERYARDLPGGPDWIAELERTARRITRPMHERSRKEIDLAMYQRVRVQEDARSVKRGEWGSFLE